MNNDLCLIPLIDRRLARGQSIPRDWAERAARFFKDEAAVWASVDRPRRLCKSPKIYSAEQFPKGSGAAPRVGYDATDMEWHG